jgi:Zn-dependent protease with chaperone function
MLRADMLDLVRQRVKRLPTGVQRLAPFLVLPGLVLLGLLIILGPDVWRTIYAYIAGICRAYISGISPGSVALDLMLLLTVIASIAGGLGILREWRRLRLLSRTISQRSSHIVSEVNRECPVVVVNDDTPFAFCYGLLRPRICYSTGLGQLLTNEELQAVLLHEELHARRRDPLKVFIARVLAAMVFFLPLSRDVRDRYLVWLEVSADQEVIRQLGIAALAQALVKLLQPKPALDLEAAISRINPTEERIKHLINPGTGSPGLLVLPRCSLATLGLTAGTGLMATGIVYSVGMLMMSTRFCQISLA